MTFAKQSTATELRQLAQDRLCNKSLAEQPSATVDPQRILHELQIHQIELELQNEELQASRADLEEALSRYKNLYDLAPVSYFTLDATGAVTQVNHAAEKLLNISNDALLGDPFAAHLSIDHGRAFTVWLDQLFAQQRPPPIEVDLLTPNQPRRAVQIVGALSFDGQQCCLSAADITDRQLLEQARFRLAELEIERRAAEATSEAKSNFLSRMSHELRTPLHAISGFAQLLQLDSKDKLDAHQHRRLKGILLASDHLLRLVEDVLDWSTMTAGSPPLHLEPVALEIALDEALQIVSPALEESGLSVSIDISAPLKAHPALVLADKTRLVQVVTNLLTNAIKYNSPGGSVHCEIFEARTGTRTIAISDTGKGMTSTQLAQIFEPFNRLGEENNGVPGMGIGLSISKELVDLMGGTLQVQSRLGLGSCFEVQLHSGSQPH